VNLNADIGLTAHANCVLRRRKLGQGVRLRPEDVG
jgi:hypothetical protein